MAMRDLVRQNGDATLPARREESYPRSNWESSEWMDKWFDNFFSRALSLTPFGNMATRTNNGWTGFVPAVNVIENQQGVQVTAELPGMDENDIELSLHNNTLTIKGEKKAEVEDKREGYYRAERTYGAFHRSVPLPEGIDADKVDATFKKGVLYVTVPRLPQSENGRKKINIKTEDEQSG
ncbi:MAG TPA: Hsp20/alpha crystallin family protein [Chloroflexia bacterium]|nr:Hsp20/alpha crystallin family protein [Chloroflexia bacterium]